MKKFNFPLQTVLNVRELRETLLQSEVGKLEHHYRAAKQSLDDLEESRLACQDEIRAKQTLQIGELILYHSYLHNLKDVCERQKAEVQKRMADLQEGRQRLTAAMRDRKILEELKDKCLEQYLENFLKEEQARLDEVASRNHTVTNGRAPTYPL